MITSILRAVCALCTAACVLTAFTACGDTSSDSGTAGNKSNSSSASAEEVSLTAEEYINKALEIKPNSLLDATTAKGDTSEYGFDNFCIKLYNGLDPEELEDGAISYASSGGNADEISVLKAKDPSKQNELTKKLEERIQVRHHDFEGYKPEELDKIDKAEVFEAGGYSILIIADDAAAIKDAFNNV